MSTRKPKPPPIWTEPAPGTRKPRFSREQIAEVALRIADTEGFDSVSMRRIADELGAGTMTLYHYIRTKDDLFALMDDAIMAKVVVAEPLAEDWRAAVTQVALGSYRAFRAHPWSIEALRGVRMGPNGFRHFEQSLAAVANAPFDLQGKLDILGIVDDYVFGHVFRASEMLAERRDFAEGRPSKAILEFTRQMIATGEFPHTAALTQGRDAADAWVRIAKFMSDEGRFYRGLDMLLDGIASAKARPRTETAARAASDARDRGASARAKPRRS